jgi:hypothetical protein
MTPVKDKNKDKSPSPEHKQGDLQENQQGERAANRLRGKFRHNDCRRTGRKEKGVKWCVLRQQSLPRSLSPHHLDHNMYFLRSTYIKSEEI